MTVVVIYGLYIDAMEWGPKKNAGGVKYKSMLPQTYKTVKESAEALTENLVSGLPSSIVTMKDWAASDSRKRGRDATLENVGWSARFEQLMMDPDIKTNAMSRAEEQK